MDTSTSGEAQAQKVTRQTDEGNDDPIEKAKEERMKEVFRTIKVKPDMPVNDFKFVLSPLGELEADEIPSEYSCYSPDGLSVILIGKGSMGQRFLLKHCPEKLLVELKNYSKSKTNSELKSLIKVLAENILIGYLFGIAQLPEVNLKEAKRGTQMILHVQALLEFFVLEFPLITQNVLRGAIDELVANELLFGASLRASAPGKGADKMDLAGDIRVLGALLRLIVQGRYTNLGLKLLSLVLHKANEVERVDVRQRKLKAESEEKQKKAKALQSAKDKDKEAGESENKEKGNTGGKRRRRRGGSANKGKEEENSGDTSSTSSPSDPDSATSSYPLETSASFQLMASVYVLGNLIGQTMPETLKESMTIFNSLMDIFVNRELLASPSSPRVFVGVDEEADPSCSFSRELIHTLADSFTEVAKPFWVLRIQIASQIHYYPAMAPDVKRLNTKGCEDNLLYVLAASRVAFLKFLLFVTPKVLFSPQFRDVLIRIYPDYRQVVESKVAVRKEDKLIRSFTCLLKLLIGVVPVIHIFTALSVFSKWRE